MAKTLICESCRREVDELIEIVSMDNNIRLEARRCRNCAEIALEEIQTKMNLIENYYRN